MEVIRRKISNFSSKNGKFSVKVKNRYNFHAYKVKKELIDNIFDIKHDDVIMERIIYIKIMDELYQNIKNKNIKETSIAVIKEKTKFQEKISKIAVSVGEIIGKVVVTTLGVLINGLFGSKKNSQEKDAQANNN